MTNRTYGQFCGLARALELVGERWALLIVRDLFLRPKRFTDLRQGLPRIPTNILSARLKELEDAGVIRRRALPRPEASVVYELTEYGRDLEDALLHLGRWGARSLGEPRPNDFLNSDALVLALRANFWPDAARGLRATFVIHVGEIIIHARIDDETLEAGHGAVPDADLVIKTGPVLRALMAGEISPCDAIDNGSVRLTGDADLLSSFVAVFRILPRLSVPPELL